MKVDSFCDSDEGSGPSDANGSDIDAHALAQKKNIIASPASSMVQPVVVPVQATIARPHDKRIAETQSTVIASNAGAFSRKRGRHDFESRHGNAADVTCERKSGRHDFESRHGNAADLLVSRAHCLEQAVETNAARPSISAGKPNCSF